MRGQRVSRRGWWIVAVLVLFAAGGVGCEGCGRDEGAPAPLPIPEEPPVLDAEASPSPVPPGVIGTPEEGVVVSLASAIPGLWPKRAPVSGSCTATAGAEAWHASYREGRLERIVYTAPDGAKTVEAFAWAGSRVSALSSGPEGALETRRTFAYEDGLLTAIETPTTRIACEKRDASRVCAAGSGYASRSVEGASGWPSHVSVESGGTVSTYDYAYEEGRLVQATQKAGAMTRTIAYAYEEGLLVRRTTTIAEEGAAASAPLESVQRLGRDASGNVTRISRRCTGAGCPAGEDRVTLTYDPGFAGTLCAAGWIPGVPWTDTYGGVVWDP